MIPVVHVALALKIDYVEHLQERVCECGTGLLPSSRKPALSEYLVNKDVVWICEVTAAVDNLDLVYTIDIVHGEIAERRYGSRAVSPTVV
jgi:hypothetical protein